MSRKITIALAAAVALSIGACGSSTGPSATDVKASLEKAARVELAPAPIPKQARDQGLVASFNNEATAQRDHQVLFLFVTKDAAVARDVERQAKGMVPPPSHMLVHDNLVVVYAADGNDRYAQVAQTVQGL
jgi:hypothetical protein